MKILRQLWLSASLFKSEYLYDPMEEKPSQKRGILYLWIWTLRSFKSFLGLADRPVCIGNYIHSQLRTSQVTD